LSSMIRVHTSQTFYKNYGINRMNPDVSDEFWWNPMNSDDQIPLECYF
jgi:hypothetical protein